MTNPRSRSALVSLFCMTVLMACDSGTDQTVSSSMPAPPQDTSEALVSVNGVNITRAQLEDHTRRKAEAQEGLPQKPEEVLRELVDIELLHQKAIDEGYDKKPEVLAEARVQNRNLIIDAMVLDTAAKANFTDDQLRAEYQEKVRGLPKFEHHARHILVKTEQEAKDVLTALNDGGDFATMAAEKSIDPTSAQGGDLGWFRSGHMVKSFADAVESLEVGQTSSSPVKSEFGYHIINLVDRRETRDQVPSFEQVKERMRTALIGELIQAQVETLRAEAEIQELAAP